MIRKATTENLLDEDLQEAFLEFWNESGRSGEFDLPGFLRNWEILIESGMGFIFVLRSEIGEVQGYLAAVIVADPFNGEKVCAENFWYVRKHARGSIGGMRLFQAFEEEAKAAGCKRCLMVHLENLTPEKLAKLYERRGYRLIERTYEKNLWESSPPSPSAQ